VPCGEHLRSERTECSQRTEHQARIHIIRGGSARGSSRHPAVLSSRYRMACQDRLNSNSQFKRPRSRLPTWDLPFREGGSSVANDRRQRLCIRLGTSPDAAKAACPVGTEAACESTLLSTTGDRNWATLMVIKKR
jgi:hypothetical protein